MTKEDFIALAAALKAAKPPFDAAYSTNWDRLNRQWSMDVIAVMNVCRAGNPKFDRNKFVTACGITNVLEP